MKRLVSILLRGASAAIALLAALLAHAYLSPADQAAAFAAAGFRKAPDGQYLRCDEGAPSASHQPGWLEVADLNGDGRPEAWVRESSLRCYGDTAEYFVLLTKGTGGWRTLLADAGIPTVLKARHRGWPDIEVGGPGSGGFPIYRWNGRAYVRRE